MNTQLKRILVGGAALAVGVFLVCVSFHYASTVLMIAKLAGLVGAAWGVGVAVEHIVAALRWERDFRRRTTPEGRCDG